MTPSLSAATGSGTLRSLPTGKLFCNPISSLRITPFIAASRVVSRNSRRVVHLKAAETEVVPEATFTFNFSDAKKANEYQNSDVEAALKFYYDGEGGQPIYDADFVAGFPEVVEDASYFDDLDNNEAYDADEYSVAGIPEAAPKKRRGNDSGDEPVDDKDEVEAAMEMERMKDLEEERILAASLEEAGLDDELPEVDVRKPTGVWEWLQEDNDEDFVAPEVVDARFPSDNEILARAAESNVEEYNTEMREFTAFLLDDFDVDRELVDDKVPDEVVLVPTVGLSPEEEAEMDGIEFDTEFTSPEVELALNTPNAVVPAGDTPLDEASFLDYIATLQAENARMEALPEVQAARAAQGGAVEEDDPTKIFEGEEAQRLFSLVDEAININKDVLAGMQLIGPEDVEDDTDLSLGFIVNEYKALAELEADGWTEETLPTVEEIDALDNALSTNQAYLEEDERLRAENPEEEYIDATDDLYANFQLFDDSPEEDDDEEVVDRNEQWVERIVELSRVTKVVKGGKIMGFRCTALVGNQAGRVGVGCDSGREVGTAVKRALVDARKNIIEVPLIGAQTVPHKVEAKFKAARCVIVPAASGTGVIAGGAIKSVLELAGIQNVLAKRLGSRSPLNNARCTIQALSELKPLKEVSKSRGVPFQDLLLPRKA